MESSSRIESVRPTVSSPDGLRIATLTSNGLEVRDTLTLHTVRTTQYKPSSKFVCVRWAPVQKGSGVSNRVLVSDEDRVHVWDLQDEDWAATIDNGTGGTGKIANVEFGCDDTEVLVFSSFGSRVTIWNLWTGHSIEIKDPKFATKGHGRNRPGCSSVFALLSRPSTQDIITLHVSKTYEVVKQFTLPTVDAQGLKWSPDGRFVAVWDTSSMGYKVLIYTCDGHLFRTYNGDCYDDGVVGLGVKSIEWAPSGDTLLVCGYEKTMALLTTRTFSPAVTITHAPTVRLASGNNVLQEVAKSSHDRSYMIASQPFSPPTASPDNTEARSRVGVSILAFNHGGNLLVTKDDSMPTTAWIWDLSTLQLRTVLVQHSVIKRLAWHPSDPNQLLIQCIQGENILYLWDSTLAEPKVMSLTDVQMSGKFEVQWLPAISNRPSTILLKDTNSCVLAYPSGRPVVPDASQDSFMSSASEAGTVDGNESDDSLDAILSGKRKHHLDADYRPELDGASGEGNPAMDDTFRNLKVGRVN